MNDHPDSEKSEQNKNQDVDTSDAGTRTQSDKAFYEKMQEFQDEERENNPWNEISNWKVFGSIAGGIISIILSMIFLSSGSTGMGLIFLSLPFVAPLVLTETGREFLKIMAEEMDDSNQIQRSSTNSKPKRICSECGWQNPQNNSYCNDCGSKLERK